MTGVINRRTLTAGALALAAAPLTAGAQTPARVPRIVLLGSLAPDDFRAKAFRDGMRELGYQDGRNIAIEHIWFERPDEIARAVAAAVAARPDAIVTFFTPSTLAIKQATRSVPVVFAGTADPVAAGIVTSLARPDSNMTGLSLMSADLAGKRLQFLKELVPELTRAVVFFNPDNPGGRFSVDQTVAAGPTLGIDVLVREARGQDDWVGPLTSLRTMGIQAVVLVVETTYTNNVARIAAAAMAANLPAIYDYAEFPHAGGLMSYGVNLDAHYRRAAYYIDRILKGMKPADLPVEQPREFELVLNKRTATALGLRIPEHLVVFATEVLE
jgi:putative tryptophan/tyrosine transport system substrate-binding protein